MKLLWCLWGILLVKVAGGSPNNLHRSSLCKRSDTPCAEDDSCSMRYIPGNSTICSAIPFQNVLTKVGQLSLGKLRLDTYLYVDKILQQTAFNITFENITWEHMQFRISLNGNPGRNTCREFVRHVNSTASSLFYDCLWSDERYEGKHFALEYEARSVDIVETAKVSFLVPFASGIIFDAPKDQRQIFVYVESIPSQLGRTTFNLHWKQLPAYLSVKSYEVLAFSEENNEELLVIGVVSDCNKGWCSFATRRWFGTLRFGIRPIFSDGVPGFISKTPIFILGADSTRPLLFGIVSCSIILPVLLYILFLLRNYVISRSMRKWPPKMLLVYTPSTTPHLHMVEALAHYLNTHCNVHALMDELDIPLSPDKDPFHWCNEAMLTADIVVVVASPYHKYLRSTAALYRTDRLLLRLLRERYGSSGKTRFCVLMPNYTTATDIPFEALGLRRYRLPEDLDFLLHLSRFEWSLPKCLAKLLSTGRTLLTELGQELTDCLAEAGADLVNNKTGYLRQVDEVKAASDKRCSEEEVITKSPKSHKIFPSWNAMEGKNERILLAEDLLNGFPGNIDTLNLLGETESCPIVQPAKKLEEDYSLDELEL